MSFLTYLPPPSPFCMKRLTLSSSLIPKANTSQGGLVTFFKYRLVITGQTPTLPIPVPTASLVPRPPGGCAYTGGRCYLRVCTSCNLRRMSGCNLCPELSFPACSRAWTVTAMWVFSCDSNHDLWLLSGFSSLSSYCIMQHIYGSYLNVMKLPSNYLFLRLTFTPTHKLLITEFPT